jgi:diguanylate cyclase (GGDEF)-like protein
MKSKGKILLMMGVSPLRALLVRELEKKGFTLLLCPGDGILQTVFDQVPHLVIVDEDFRDGRGRGLALEIKEDLVLKHIPVVVLVKNREILPREKNYQANFYFEKSRNLKELLSHIRLLLKSNYHELDLNPLTYLPGSRSSLLRIERAIRSKKKFAVCCIDVLNMGFYNKAYGDARGDEVIVRLGKIIQGIVKRQGLSDDFVGHLGGDDFVVVTRSDFATKISEAIIQDFDAVIHSFYQEVDERPDPSISLSIVIIDNQSVPLSDISQISRVAAELKESMKGLPGSGYLKYHGKKEEAPDRYAVFFDHLIKERKIKTFYQPIVDLRTKVIVGYEALTRGLAERPPSQDTHALFSVARESGKVKELDRVCVEQALLSGQNLRPERKLFLNVNHETLIDPKFMQNLLAKRGKIGFKNIVIEVTEQSILRSFDKVREALLELKNQGVCVAIDDLGGGAVSLRDVAILKPDYIKFDRSLIRQIDSSITKQQIILSLILFANGIHAITTAEGIETKREYETLRMCGIGLGQGYYFAKPSPELIESAEF